MPVLAILLDMAGNTKKLLNKYFMRPMPAVMLLGLLNIGCAGPSSPFGGIFWSSGDGRKVNLEASRQAAPPVAFVPSRQLLHKPTDLRIAIAPSALGEETELSALQGLENLDLVISYNGRDITQSFKRYQSSSEPPASGPDPETIWLKFPRLRLSPAQSHNIEFFARPLGSDRPYTQANYLPPYCELNERRSVADTSPFSPDPDLLQSILQVSEQYQINPALMVGLIAQESGFRSTAVSSARAVGLTQVTPVAAAEIERRRPQWTRHPSLSRWSPREIRQAIDQGRVTARQDWRLDPKKSIEGGALYLEYLERYWNLQSHTELLDQHPEIDYGAVILASYNSGAARVKNRILDNPSDWLGAPGLTEAFRYVNSIYSYCYHFAAQEESADEEVAL